MTDQCAPVHATLAPGDQKITPFFSDATTTARYAKAKMVHSHLQDITFAVELHTECGPQFVVALPSDTEVEGAVLLRCARDAASEDVFYHPETEEMLYLVFDGCDADWCFTLEQLVDMRTPGKKVEFEVSAGQVRIW